LEREAEAEVREHRLNAARVTADEAERLLQSQYERGLRAQKASRRRAQEEIEREIREVMGSKREAAPAEELVKRPIQLIKWRTRADGRLEQLRQKALQEELNYLQEHSVHRAKSADPARLSRLYTDSGRKAERLALQKQQLELEEMQWLHENSVHSKVSEDQDVVAKVTQRLGEADSNGRKRRAAARWQEQERERQQLVDAISGSSAPSTGAKRAAMLYSDAIRRGEERQREQQARQMAEVKALKLQSVHARAQQERVWSAAELQQLGALMHNGGRRAMRKDKEKGAEERWQDESAEEDEVQEDSGDDAGVALDGLELEKTAQRLRRISGRHSCPALLSLLVGLPPHSSGADSDRSTRASSNAQTPRSESRRSGFMPSTISTGITGDGRRTRKVAASRRAKSPAATAAARPQSAEPAKGRRALRAQRVQQPRARSASPRATSASPRNRGVHQGGRAKVGQGNTVASKGVDADAGTGAAPFDPRPQVDCWLSVPQARRPASAQARRAASAAGGKAAVRPRSKRRRRRSPAKQPEAKQPEAKQPEATQPEAKQSEVEGTANSAEQPRASLRARSASFPNRFSGAATATPSPAAPLSTALGQGAAASAAAQGSEGSGNGAAVPQARASAAKVRRAAAPSVEARAKGSQPRLSFAPRPRTSWRPPAKSEEVPASTPSFYGRWTGRDEPGKRIDVIRDGYVFWQGGLVTEITVQGSRQFVTILEGKRYHAKIAGGYLVWSDGDVWAPVQEVPPKAPPKARAPPSPRPSSVPVGVAARRASSGMRR